MSLGVPGLGLVDELIDADEEARLLAAIDAGPWSEALRRRVQHHGWRYDYKGRSVGEALGPLPAWAAELAARLVNEGRFVRTPDQVSVNEYLPGQGIAAHVDAPAFGAVVASLSLGGDVTMTLASTDVRLPRRSLLVLAGAARSRYPHAIAARKSDEVGGERVPRSRRVSVTFRTLRALDDAPVDRPSAAEHARFFERRLARLDGPLRRGLARLRPPADVDLVQLELFEDRQAESFPIEALFKRKRDGVDRYTSAQSHSPARSARAFVELVTEPLGDASLARYIDAEPFDDLFEACDLVRYERLCQWIVRAWDETLGAAFPVAAYFLRMGDDAEGGTVWDLRARRDVPWQSMY